MKKIILTISILTLLFLVACTPMESPAPKTDISTVRTYDCILDEAELLNNLHIDNYNEYIEDMIEENFVFKISDLSDISTVTCQIGGREEGNIIISAKQEETEMIFGRSKGFCTSSGIHCFTIYCLGVKNNDALFNKKVSEIKKICNDCSSDYSEVGDTKYVGWGTERSRYVSLVYADGSSIHNRTSPCIDFSG